MPVVNFLILTAGFLSIAIFGMCGFAGAAISSPPYASVVIAVTLPCDSAYGDIAATGQYSGQVRHYEGVGMAIPAVVWRNPKSISRRRLWNRARHDETSTLFIVVRSGDRETEWEGLPNLEMIEGGCQSPRPSAIQPTLSRA